MQFENIDSELFGEGFILVRVLHQTNAQAARKTSLMLSSISSFNIGEWRIVSGLYTLGICTQKVLVDVTGDDQGQISRSLVQLKKKGLVRSEKSQKDRRAINFELTKKGLQLVEAAQPEMGRYFGRISNALTDQEKATFIALASRLIEAAELVQSAEE